MPRVLEILKGKIKLIIFVSILIFIIFLSYFIYWNSKMSRFFVAFLDIGQGDSIFINFGDGRQVLIDAGPNSQVLRALGEVMPFYDREIDAVFLTHPDADHIGGFNFILERYKILNFIESGRETDTNEFISYKKKRDLMVKNYGSRLELAKAGERICLDNTFIISNSPDLKDCFDILWPDPDFLISPKIPSKKGIKKLNKIEKPTNDWSIIVRLIHEGMGGNRQSFLFTGDAPKYIENILVSKYGNNLESDFLKVGHHGSKNSSSIEFIEKVKPKVAIISAGLKNRYGHPNKEVIDILIDHKIQIRETYKEGNIIIEGG